MDERLRKERETLQEYKSQIEFSEHTSATTTTLENYQETLEYMRTKNPSELDFLEGVTDYATAMALAQINIEKRIAALEAEIERNVPPVTVTAPPVGQETAPPVQRVGKWQAVKNWFKKTFFSSAPQRQAEVVQPVVAQPVVQEQATSEQLVNQIRDVTVTSQFNPQAVLRKGTDAEGGIKDDTKDETFQGLKSRISRNITEHQALERALQGGQQELAKKGLTAEGARQRMEQLKAETERYEARFLETTSILSPYKIDEMRKDYNGARGAVGNFISQWSKPVVQPVETECGMIIKQMELGGFDYKRASEFSENKMLSTGKSMPFNPVIFEFSERMISTWKVHMQGDAAKEYVRLFYDVIGEAYAGSFPAGEQHDLTVNAVHKRVREIMPTKGISPMGKLLSEVPEGQTDKRRFMVEANRIIGFLPLFKSLKDSGEPMDPMLNSLLRAYDELSAMIEEIGQETCEKRVKEMNEWRKANPGLCGNSQV